MLTSLKPSKLIHFILVNAVLVVSSCTNKQNTKTPKQSKKTDSIQVWFDQSKLPETPSDIASYLLGKAKKEASKISNDTLKSQYFTKLSFLYMGQKDSLAFRIVNKQAIELNTQINDSLHLAEAYWDLASFFKQNKIQDSAYFHFSETQQVFEALDNQFYAALLLKDMAHVQSDIGDYTSSDASVIRAIEKLKPLEKYKQLANTYSLLADNAKMLNELERSITHYEESLFYLDKAKASPFKITSTKHNIALVYQKQEKHEKAIEIFLEVLSLNNLEEKNPRIMGRALNNLGYSYLKTKQYDKLPNIFLKAQKIQKRISDIGGQSSGALKLAEYYLSQKDSLNALVNLEKAKNLSIQTGNSKQVLNVLQILSLADSKKAPEYIQKYIALNDSLQIQERQIRNKFARIRFETDEFIAKNEVLAREKELWAGIAIIIVLLGIASLIIINQRVRNKILKFRQEQQANNQEIFNLMLAQGEKVEEGKKIEQKRVSEELHDGVLGKMLGARMMLLGLNKKTDANAIEERAKAIKMLQNVEGEVRSISHELSHAAYQKIYNFILTIKDLIQTIQSASKINIEFEFKEEIDYDALSGDIKINLYRLIQESLQNCVKHADCKNIRLNFYADEAFLKVEIVDDGKGFAKKKGKKGIGMRNMKSRIHKINGTWDITSEIGKGTAVLFVIPLVSNDHQSNSEISIKEPHLQDL